jgi:formamidopyrimidine-DNA glycosylase
VPELPEVETTRRGISPHIRGRTVERVVIRHKQLRWPIPDDLPKKVIGQPIRDVSRRAKYLLIHFDHGCAIWHLGMSGNLRVLAGESPPGKHDHVDWVLSGGVILRFNDPRRFGALVWTEDDPNSHFLLDHLGPEPLSDDFDGEYLFQATRKSQQNIKTWLMNASNVVGVGNIYANESLFGAGIHPLKVARTLSRPRCEKLAAEIKKVLARAIEQGGTTLRDFVGGDGKPGYFAQELNVYGRGGEPCKTCAKPLIEKRVGQRTTVYCNVCQK